MQKTVIIIGAGPAGLTAAYELLQNTDYTPIIYEASTDIGGIAQTFTYKGNQIDIGGHRFFSKNERVMQWWFNILPPQGVAISDEADDVHLDYVAESIVTVLCPECKDDYRENIQSESHNTLTLGAIDPEKTDAVMLHRSRLSRIYYGKKFFPYPLKVTLTVAFRLGILKTIKIAVSYILAQILPKKDETFLDGFFINRFGNHLYQTFFKAYTEKVWGVPCNQIRAEWGAQRIKGLSLRLAIIHAVKDLLSSDFQQKQKQRETSLINRFYYPKYGPGQMWETVAKHIQKAGGHIHFGQNVNGIHVHNGRVQSVKIEDTKTGTIQEVECIHCISTMPIKHLIASISPSPEALVQEVANGLQYRDFITVGLLASKMHIKESSSKIATMVKDNWLYIQDAGVHVGRVQIFNNWSPYMVADPNTVWIGLEYFVNEGDALWMLSDEELIELGKKEMETVGLLQYVDILDGCVKRVQKAYPAYFGTYESMHVIREYTNTIENLWLVGRNGMHRYNNQDHSMLSAMLAVEAIQAGTSNKDHIWQINMEQEYHEERKISEPE